MAYRWADHTAELELEIEAATKPAVFADALEAFAELVADGDGPAAERELEVRGDEPAALLVGWLDELTYLAETQGFVPERATSLELSTGRLRATVRGRTGDPRHLVKAVTLHRLAFAADGEGFRARVVLDV